MIIAGCAILVFVAAARLELFRQLNTFFQTSADWFLDDLVVVSAVMSVALIIYGYRRLKELSSEMGARGKAEREAQWLARHDPLTGLANRRLFAETLKNALLERREGEQAAILMLDLDGFKAVNDTYGHAEGDRVLSAVGNLLSGLLHDATLARMGGDEFAIIVPRIDARESIAALARRIVSGFLVPFQMGNASATLGVSIGIVVAPGDGSDPDALVRRADLAMYRAKAEGRSLICFYTPEMEALAEGRARMERALRQAVERDTLVPHYQPIVSLDGNRIIGFEALARWGTDGDAFGPDQFIPLAEETGLIGRLGDQLLRKACVDAKAWPRDLFLAFNISGAQLCDPGAGLRILAILSKTGLDPHRLEIEVTETALVKTTEVARGIIDELRTAGVMVALDDFGTGYATLTQLISLRFDKIKIDRSFVDRLGKDTESLAVVRAIVGLAKGFGLVTVAEGVEREDQRACLQEYGCLEGQGFLFSKAVPSAEIAGLLSSQRDSAKVA